MKIDENIINEKAMELIDEIANYDFVYNTDDLKEFAVQSIGVVQGILDMAEALKGELKNEQKNNTTRSCEDTGR